jgi:hypothetical protein
MASSEFNLVQAAWAEAETCKLSLLEIDTGMGLLGVPR